MGVAGTASGLEVENRSEGVGSAKARVEGLTPEEFELLGQIFEQDHDYVDHPLLIEEGAEQEFFGESVGEPAFPGRFEKMTAEKERDAFLRYNLARMRVVQLLAGREDAESFDTATGKELAEWFRRVLAIRAEIVNANFPLVMAMTKHSRFASLDINEMISEGNMALLRSINKYDLTRGYRFSSYSCRSILKAFSRVALRIGRHRHRFPTEHEETFELNDQMEQRRKDQNDHFVDVLQAVLSRNSAHLSEMERLVIKERFAVEPEKEGEEPEPKTLGEVGDMVGLTKERVRQIQNRALDKLRTAMKNRFAAA